MTGTTGPRSTRARPAKTPLSLDAIVDAGLAIVRAEGIDAVTMRRVAAALDTGAASLYVYVRNRDELLAQMLDRISGHVRPQEPDPGRWREQVHELLDGWRRAMETYPGIAEVAVGNPPTTPRTLEGAEYLMSLLLCAGITPRDAAWACDILPLITTATAQETTVHEARGHDPATVVGRMTEAFAALPPERFPNVTRYVAELTSGDGDERYRFAVDVFLDGLVARSSRER